MRERKNHLILVSVIVAALVGVGLIAIPGSPFHKGATLGLDLQGGLEVVLQAVPPKGHTLTDEDLAPLHEAAAMIPTAGRMPYAMAFLAATTEKPRLMALAPIALYPDPLLAQMLMCSTDPVALIALNDFLKSNPTLKGTELQDAATKNKFEPSFVALALFPTVVKQMVVTLAQTTDLGKAFKDHRSLVFESIQRLRMQAHDAGKWIEYKQMKIRRL